MFRTIDKILNFDIFNIPQPFAQAPLFQLLRKSTIYGKIEIKISVLFNENISLFH